jgi:hypothetical protein
MIFNANSDEKIKLINQYVNSNIKSPVVKSSVSTLGGIDRAAIMIKLSLDDRSTWPNGIFENSRFMHISIDTDGTVEQFCKDYKIAGKFRKIHVKSLKQAIEKINKYISEVK